MKAIIAITSWKKRINKLSEVISRVKDTCGEEYKIVLTLSEEEFPNKEKELSKDLVSCIKTTGSEILWVYKNYKPFKKVLFAMQKYPDLPIITTDDDTLPKSNYYEELYSKWKNDPHAVYTLYRPNIKNISGMIVKTATGMGSIYPPSSLLELLNYIDNPAILNTNNDDSFYSVWLALKKIDVKFLGYDLKDLTDDFNDDSPITKGVKSYGDFINDKKIIYDELTKAMSVPNKEDLLIVSFTSWKKRINRVVHSFELMMNQSLIPDKVILNLAIEEFPNKEKDLPKNLIEFINSHNQCEIFWVQKNNNVWKKFMPTINRFPDAVVMPIDDDIEYPTNYVAELYKYYLLWDKRCPIVCYPNPLKKIDGIENIYKHSGGFSLITRKFFGDELDKFYKKVIESDLSNRWASDDVYSHIIWANGYRYKLCDSINAVDLYSKSYSINDPYSSNYDSEWKKRFEKNSEILAEYIKDTYNKDLKSLFDDQIVVSFTTWKQRDKGIRKILENLTKQTKKPDKIILWLSEKEYDGTIPEHLIQCKNDGLLDDILFVSENTFSHKRWEIFRNYFQSYVVMIDDDILYPQDYIESLYNAAKRYNIPCEYLGRTLKYNGTQKSLDNFTHISMRNEMLSGLSCFPPCTFPIEMLAEDNMKLRTRFNVRSDDAWVKAWLIKYNIPIYNIGEWKKGPLPLDLIEGSQEVGTYTTYECKSIKGIERRNINFVESSYIVGVIDKFKQIFDGMDVKTCLEAIGIDYVFPETIYRSKSKPIPHSIEGWEGPINEPKHTSPSIPKTKLIFTVNLNEDLPNVIPETGYDYICFSDHHFKKEGWQVVVTDKLKLTSDKEWMKMNIKYHPKQYITKNYQQIMYVDQELPKNYIYYFDDIFGYKLGIIGNNFLYDHDYQKYLGKVWVKICSHTDREKEILSQIVDGKVKIYK